MLTPYELTNDQRRYFGLTLVDNKWDRECLTDTVIVYFDADRIAKVIHYKWGYYEYDTDIETVSREIILPKTLRGKNQKLTVSRILKIKGCGVQFSGSFLGGGIHVYDNKRNMYFIKSFIEEGEIKTYNDIDNWISDYISKLAPNHFERLDEQLTRQRLKISAKEGDILAFPIGRKDFGFAKVLVDVFGERKNGGILRPELSWVHPRSLIVAPYAFYSESVEIEMDMLHNIKTLPAVCIFDLDVYRGEMPIVGHIPLTEIDRRIPLPSNNTTSITIPYTKTDIKAFISNNENNQR